MTKTLKSKNKDRKKLLIFLNWVGLGGAAFYALSLLAERLIMDRFGVFKKYDSILPTCWGCEVIAMPHWGVVVVVGLLVLSLITFLIGLFSFVCSIVWLIRNQKAKKTSMIISMIPVTVTLLVLIYSVFKSL